MAAPRGGVSKGPIFSPTDFFLYTGLEIPDPITFIISPHWLNRPSLYPRQATLMKVIFLRTDLLTDYDYSVIAEWERSFRNTGNNGITIGILDRMEQLRAQGYKWFREILLVMGRRAGKGHISALAMSYVLWNYMAKGDPQAFYGIDRDKKLTCLIYAGKKEQARDNLWRDLTNVIVGSTCFQPYVNRPLAESLSMFAPHDKVRIAKMMRNTETSLDMATFKIEPKEATLMSGRGSASFMQGYDEMAHVVASGANRSAEDIFNAATPALDQFKKDAFIIEPSSPWQMTGQFYRNFEKANQVDENGNAVYPAIMALQLASWEIYYDWERSQDIELFPREFAGDLDEYLHEPLPKLMKLKGAVQVFDEAMELEEASNPETFKVERRAHWQATMDAYLDPDKIVAMFNHDLEQTRVGRMDRYYKAHGDPSSTNANFGLAVAHTERNADGYDVCVFDLLHHWNPADYPDHTLDYVEVVDELWDILKGFPVDDFSVDQFSSGPVRSMLQRKSMNERLFKTVTIHEVTATAGLNWKKAENFKVALNQGWIRAPQYDQAELELKFLRLVATATSMRVDKQDLGPVRTKDVADAMFECVWSLLGEQIENYRKGFAAAPTPGVQGGIDPFSSRMSSEAEKVFQALGGGAAGRMTPQDIRRGNFAPDRGGRIFRDPGFRR